MSSTAFGVTSKSKEELYSILTYLLSLALAVTQAFISPNVICNCPMFFAVPVGIWSNNVNSIGQPEANTKVWLSLGCRPFPQSTAMAAWSHPQHPADLSETLVFSWDLNYQHTEESENAQAHNLLTDTFGHNKNWKKLPQKRNREFRLSTFGFNGTHWRSVRLPAHFIVVQTMPDGQWTAVVKRPICLTSCLPP